MGEEKSCFRGICHEARKTTTAPVDIPRKGETPADGNNNKEERPETKEERWRWESQVMTNYCCTKPLFLLIAHAEESRGSMVTTACGVANTAFGGERLPLVGLKNSCPTGISVLGITTDRGARSMH